MVMVVCISRPLFLFLKSRGLRFSVYRYTVSPTTPLLTQPEVIVMLATAMSRYSQTVIERVFQEKIMRGELEEYKDDSIELRRHRAAETAYRVFEQHKERALTENHRTGFLR